METTIPKLYNAWFCPFAQRAWIALLAKKVKFEYIEQNPYNKTPEWMSISPTGLVPVIVHKGKSIYESSICVEYIDEAFNTNVALMPKDPYQRAYARIWGKFVEEKLIAPLYASLLRPSQKERDEAQAKFLDGLDRFVQAKSPDKTFFQQDTIGYVDILLTPMCICWELLQGIREIGFPEFPDSPVFMRWFESIKEHPAVQATVAEPSVLTDAWKMYVEKKRKGQPTSVTAPK